MHEVWPVRTVRELADEGVIERPLDGNHGEIHPKTSDFVPAGIPFVMAADLHDGRVDVEHCKFISPEQAKSLRKGFARAGDILLSHKATIGRTAIVQNLATDYIVLTPQVTYYRVRDPDRLSNRFLKFYFDSPRFQQLFESWANSGSTRAYLGITAQLDLPILFPPIAQQRAIAHVLGPLDDKLELNRRMNRTLDELATTLFRSWFVDFDPVVAKAAGRKPVHLRPELASFFPSHFQDSELGPIPQGWEVKTIEGLARYVNGGAFTKGASGKGRMVIRIAELNSGPGGSTVYSDIDVAPEHLARPGDLLFAWSGSLDVYRWYRDEAIINQHIFKVVCDKYPQWFVHEELREAMPFFQDVAADKATTMGHIKREHLSQALVAVPPKEILDAADKIFQSLYEKQLANERESLTLAALRDTLLPKLLSAELWVKQAEEHLAAAI